MNKDYILFNLHEAREEIERTIRGIENECDYDEPEFQVAITHAYHHINTAWNARNATKEQAFDCSETNFEAWRQFPDDIYMSTP